MKIELKKLSINLRMSEETTCFVADLYIEGVKAGTASNQGHGGPTDYRALDSPFARNLIMKAEAFCKALPPEPEFKLPMDLEMYIDNLVAEEENKKILKQFETKLAKDCLTGVCFGVRGKSYQLRFFKGRTIAQVMALPNGRVALENLIKDIKSKLKPNEEILNTNLGDLLK